MVKKSAKKAAKKPARRAAKTASRSHPPRTAAKRAIPRGPTGLKRSPAGLYIPAALVSDSSEGVVSAAKLQKGLAAAKKQITNMIQEIVDTATEDYEISEIEFAASFSADGKFMGFGVGGEATIVIRIRPCP